VSIKSCRRAGLRELLAGVVIEFKDGRRVAGVLAIGSVALTLPETHGVYLSREWTLDENGDLLAEVPGTKGVMIANSVDIRTIRELSEGDNGG